MGRGYLFAGEQLMLAPGAYHLGVEVEDQATKAVGTFRDSLRVRRFGYDALEASSLLLARRIVERQDRPFGREQFMILPDPLMQCAQGGQVSCYFEVYNLAQDAFGATHYRVAYQMRVLVEGRTGEVEPEWTTVVSHTLRGLAGVGADSGDIGYGRFGAGAPGVAGGGGRFGGSGAGSSDDDVPRDVVMKCQDKVMKWFRVARHIFRTNERIHPEWRT